MIDEYLDFIYDLIDNLAQEERFDIIDMMLDHLSIYMDNSYLLAYMTATLPIKSKLKNRETFVRQATMRMLERGFNKDTWAGLV